jgi:hypothetical protein
MEADGVGLSRATSNDDKAGGSDETKGREGGSLGKKLTKGEARSKGEVVSKVVMDEVRKLVL